MSGFLEKLKKHLSSVELDSSLTVEEHLENFRIAASAYIDVRLKTMQAHAEKIDAAITAFFKENSHRTVAAQDAFSKQFEEAVRFEIEAWIKADDSLRERFGRAVAAYGKKLKPASMLEAYKAELAKAEKRMQDHVLEANRLGEEWTRRMDSAGLHVTDKMIKNAIRWFKNLTLVELKKDYMRAFKD
jgi:ribosomal protein L11 methylase PrmA